jgi:hypothetical protein
MAQVAVYAVVAVVGVGVNEATVTLEELLPFLTLTNRAIDFSRDSCRASGCTQPMRPDPE